MPQILSRLTLNPSRLFRSLLILLIFTLGINIALAQNISLGFVAYDGANLIVQHSADAGGTYEFEFCLSPGGCFYPTIYFSGAGSDTLAWGGFSPIQANTTYTVRARFQSGGAWSNSVSCTTNAQANACTTPPTPTATWTLTPSSTHTDLPTATDTAIPTATDTIAPTETDTAIPTATDTIAPTETDTAIPTATDTIAPTETDTAIPTATDTIAPTETDTYTPTPTDTDAPTPTNTDTPLHVCIVVTPTVGALYEDNPAIVFAYNVQLNVAPASGEIVKIYPMYDSMQVFVSPLTRSLTSSTWNTGLNFAVMVVGDEIAEGSPHYTAINHIATSNISGSPFNDIRECETINLDIYEDNPPPTPTYAPPTWTSTPPLPTWTSTPPLPTWTSTPPLPTWTSTPPLPTWTNTPPLPTWTSTPPLPTWTSTPPLPTWTSTPPLPTWTNTPTITATRTITSTRTVTSTRTNTPTITLTRTITPTSTATRTFTPRPPTVTATRTNTLRPTNTATWTNTPTSTPQATRTPTPTLIGSGGD